MPDVRLDRTDGAETFFIRVVAKSLCERGDFDGVAERRPCPVRFDVADGFRLDLRHRQRLFNHARLPFNARRGVADFQRAVVVNCCPFNHRMNRVAIGQRIVQPTSAPRRRRRYL